MNEPLSLSHVRMSRRDAVRQTVLGTLALTAAATLPVAMPPFLPVSDSTPAFEPADEYPYFGREPSHASEALHLS